MRDAKRGDTITPAFTTSVSLFVSVSLAQHEPAKNESRNNVKTIECFKKDRIDARLNLETSCRVAASLQAVTNIKVLIQQILW